MKLTAQHWLVLAGQLMSLSTMIASLDHGWTDAKHPAFVAAVLMQVATLIGALCGQSVMPREAWTPEERAAASPNPPSLRS